VQSWQQHREKTRRKRTHPRGESYYDLLDDWNLIESSFLKQYGVRLRTEDDMSYEEFCTLLSGIMYDTPLGRIVSIRAEKDPKIIKNFTREQNRIRTEWMARKYGKDGQAAGTGLLLAMQKSLKEAYCRKK
jgi:hypothetical protein